MRYVTIDRRNAADKTALAAVWPSLEDALAVRPAEVAEAPLPTFTSTPAAPDVPAAVGGMVVAAYAGLLVVFFALFARSAAALFAISICALFVAIFFAVPRIFFAIEADPSRRPSLSRFMSVGLDTLTGRTGGADALVQMLIVPVAVTLGLAAMGIAGLVYIP